MTEQPTCQMGKKQPHPPIPRLPPLHVFTVSRENIFFPLQN